MFGDRSAAALFGLGALVGAVVATLITIAVMVLLFHAAPSVPPLGAAMVPVAARMVASPIQPSPPPPQEPRMLADDPAVAIDSDRDKQAQNVMAAMKQRQGDEDRALATPAPIATGDPAGASEAPGASIAKPSTATASPPRRTPTITSKTNGSTYSFNP